IVAPRPLIACASWSAMESPTTSTVLRSGDGGVVVAVGGVGADDVVVGADVVVVVGNAPTGAAAGRPHAVSTASTTATSANGALVRSTAMEVRNTFAHGRGCSPTGSTW